MELDAPRPTAPTAAGLFASRDLSAPHFGFLQRCRDVGIVAGRRPAVGRILFSDSVPAWTTWRWRIAALRTVSRNGVHGPVSPVELRERMSELRERLVGVERLEELSRTLWEMETLACRFFLRAGSGLRLDAERLPLEARPIAHIGMGLAAAIHAGFDVPALARWIDARADAEYACFAYEGAGALLATYRRDAFGLVMDVLGRLGWTLELPHHRYRPDSFADFQDFRSRLLAHGYGRLLYLKSPSFAAAVRTAKRTPYLPFDALVRGITAAYAMVSSTALPQALRLAAAEARGPELSSAIHDGLVNVLAFFEWMVPGCLRGLAVDAGSAALVRTAESEARAARGDGLPPPFALGCTDAER